MKKEKYKELLWKMIIPILLILFIGGLINAVFLDKIIHFLFGTLTGGIAALIAYLARLIIIFFVGLIILPIAIRIINRGNK